MVEDIVLAKCMCFESDFNKLASDVYISHYIVFIVQFSMNDLVSITSVCLVLLMW